MIRELILAFTTILVFVVPTIASSRVISLSPSSTEIITRILNKGQLVAVTNNCDYPESVSSLPKIGGMSLNYEKIISLNPDYAIGIGNSDQTREKLKKLKIKTLILHLPNSLSDLKSQILEIGEFIHKKKEAEALVDEMNRELLALQEKSSKDTSKLQPKTLLILWLTPTTVIGGKSHISELLTLGGLNNVMKDSTLTHTRLSKESLYQKDPEIVILSNPSLLKTAKENALLKSKKLISDINPDLYLRPGPRNIEAIKAFRALTQ